MAINIIYRAESVGPICRKLANAADLVAHREDAIADLRTAPVAPPVDPLAPLWNDTQDAAEAFANLDMTRSTVAQQGIEDLIAKLQQVRQTQLVPVPVAVNPDRQVAIRWGSRWAGRADIEINTAEAVALARDKRGSRQALRGICPETWWQRSQVQLPCVVRPRRHHAGNRFFVCRTPDALNTAINRCGPGWYASELIEKTNEYRVFVLQGRVVCVSERFPANATDVAWNLAAGGRLINVKRGAWPLNVAHKSIEAARRTGLDWAAVDACVDNRGRVLIFEVNTAPGLKNEYTISQIAWAFEQIPQHLDLPQITTTPTTWQAIIHPSLRNTDDAVATR